MKFAFEGPFSPPKEQPVAKSTPVDEKLVKFLMKEGHAPVDIVENYDDVLKGMQEEFESKLGEEVSEVGKVLQEKLLRAWSKNKLMIAGMLFGAAGTAGMIKLTSAASSHYFESRMVAGTNPETRRGIEKIYGHNMVVRLAELNNQGHEARQAREHLPVGQSPEVSVEGNLSGIAAADWQRYIHASFPIEVRSSTTILDVRRTDRRISMGYNMSGMEAAHCTRSLSVEHPEEGSHIVFTPDGDTGFARNDSMTLRHEMGHSIDPQDSPDMPLAVRHEAMYWLGQRVVLMENSGEQNQALNIPAGQGFLQLSYPMNIQTADLHQRRMDRATEYWAEVFSRVSAVEGAEKDPLGWEHYAVQYLVNHVGSGIPGRSVEALTQDAYEHVRFMRKALPYIDWPSLTRQSGQELTRMITGYNRRVILDNFFANTIFYTGSMSRAAVRLIESAATAEKQPTWSAFELSLMTPDRISTDFYPGEDRPSRLPPDVATVRQAVEILHRIRMEEMRRLAPRLSEAQLIELEHMSTEARSHLANLAPEWRGEAQANNVRELAWFRRTEPFRTNVTTNPAVSGYLWQVLPWEANQILPLDHLSAEERALVEQTLSLLRRKPLLLAEWMQRG